MGQNIKTTQLIEFSISEKTKDLLSKFYDDKNSAVHYNHAISNGMVSYALLEDLFNYEEFKKLEKKKKYLAAKLQESFLADSLKHFGVEHVCQPKSGVPWYKKLQYGFLTITGIFLALFDGLKGSTTFFGLFIFISPTLLLGIAVLFSTLSLITFFVLDLDNISEGLGIKLKNSQGIIDAYLEQIMLIDKLSAHIGTLIVNENQSFDVNELQKYSQVLNLLKTQHESLVEEGKKLQAVRNKNGYKAARLATSCLIGPLYIIGGLFTGKALVMSCAAFFGVTLAVLSWPVIVGAVVLAAVALISYIVFQHPGVERFLGKLFHLDVENIKKLTDNEQQQGRLLNLELAEQLVQSKIERLEQSQEDNTELSTQAINTPCVSPSTKLSQGHAFFSSANDECKRNSSDLSSLDDSLTKSRSSSICSSDSFQSACEYDDTQPLLANP